MEDTGTKGSHRRANKLNTKGAQKGNPVSITGNSKISKKVTG